MAGPSINSHARKLTKEQIAELVRLRVDGEMSIIQIAKRFGVTVANVSKHIARRGHKIEHQFGKLSADQAAEVRRLATEGKLSGSQIAEKMGIGQQAVYYHLRNIIWPRRSEKCAAARRALAIDGLKYCPRCQRDLPLKQFHKNKFAVDGVQVHCRTCCAVSTRRRVDRRKAARLCVVCGSRPLPSLREKGRVPYCERCYMRKTAGQNLRNTKLWLVLRDKLLSQRFRCAYTGEVLVLGVNDSVDHILPRSRFPEIAREMSNVEWVTRRVNEMKKNLTRDEFLDLLRGIVERAH